MTEKEWRNRFALKLQQLMLRYGFTETMLAARSNLGQPAIHRYLYAQRTPSILSALNIARAFGISLDELCDYGEIIDRYELKGSGFYDEFRRKIQ